MECKRNDKGRKLMATTPVVGNTYIYAPKHGTGYGHSHKGDVLSAEMHELDLKPDTVVTVVDIDEESGGRVLVDWIDDKELPRITSIDPDEFGSDFKKGA